MTCQDCTDAKVRYHGRYSTWCNGCMARAVSRSLAAFHALDPQGSGDKDGLRDVLERSFSPNHREDARKAVWSWWQQDHPVEAAAVQETK